MNKFIINNGSLEITSGETVLLLTPLKNIAFTSLLLYQDVPTISLYNINVGQNESLFTAPLLRVADNDGNFFTIDSFLAFASSNFGMTMTEGDSPTPRPTPTDGITFKFPIESGQTIVENDFVQLSDRGEIFKVESTGSVPISMPIGESTMFSEETAPEQDGDNLVRWIDDENFIFLYSHYNTVAVEYEAYILGGKLNSKGGLDFNNKPTLVSSSARYVEFDLDMTSLDENSIRGLCSFVSGSPRNSEIRTRGEGVAFQYKIDTQEFTFGESLTEDYGTGDSRNSILTDSLGNGAYLLASTYRETQAVYTARVTEDLVIELTPKTPIEVNQGRGHLVSISDSKAVLLFNTNSANMKSTIINITPKGEVSLGNTSESAFASFNSTICTAKLNDQNKFYVCIPDIRGGNPLIVEQTYDTVNDIVVWNPNSVVVSANIYPTDISFYPLTNVLALSGAVNNNIPSLCIINFASASTIVSAVGTTTGINVGCDVNSIGGVVFSYASDSGSTASGTSSYGELGDIVSNLDPEKTIGVASDSLGNVEISGSVITNSSLDLTINSKVYVDGTGVISTTNSDGAISIGFAITNTSFILTITR
jgi:hypothetical protein